ncbi:hypothetical protein [Pseudokineococcus lusitanus]|uniref:Uncharacterized protein n=1 Tax=Pseudokineococcus lusitanus TaxID=763993 RepID=A0A3N1HR45_9ACTN|nr:hypothetical protein [Pseudokineococcus lusitanus]ROP44910.1 hypothetical protein EDC03_1040 [Pseudokineococcus lusitanus]
MTPRPLRSLLLATTLALAAGLVPPASAAPPTDDTVPAAATDDPGCAPEATVPRSVSIDRPVVEVAMPLSNPCAAPRGDVVVYSEYDRTGPSFGGSRWTAADDVVVWRFDDQVVPPGPYQVRTRLPGTYSIFEASPTTVGFGSRVRLTGVRDGEDVTFRLCAAYYNGRRDAFVPWVRDLVVQRLGADGVTWEYVKTHQMDAGGCGDFVLRDVGVETYQARASTGAKIFGRTSPALRV